LETIFDGIQRPLKTIAELSKSVYVPRGVDVPSLDQDKSWDYTPASFKVGDLIGGGDIVGSVYENDLIEKHSIMVSPKIQGRIVELMPAGQYTLADPIAYVENASGKKTPINMSHFWAVRNPRPVAEKLAGATPLLTGQRVLDALFPTV